MGAKVQAKFQVEIDHIISTLTVISIVVVVIVFVIIFDAVIVAVVTLRYPWKLLVDLRLLLSYPRFI